MTKPKITEAEWFRRELVPIILRAAERSSRAGYTDWAKYFTNLNEHLLKQVEGECKKSESDP